MAVGGQMVWPSQYYPQYYPKPLGLVTYTHYPFQPYPVNLMNFPGPVIQTPVQFLQSLGQDYEIQDQEPNIEESGPESRSQNITVTKVSPREGRSCK